MRAGHDEAQRLNRCCIGLHWRPNGITENDVALSSLLPSCYQDAVLPSSLHVWATGFQLYSVTSHLMLCTGKLTRVNKADLPSHP